MDFSRKEAESRSRVVVGSVWESRIKFDEVRGGIKVFNGDEESTDCKSSMAAKLQSGQIGGRRKTWKSEGSDGFAFFDKSSIIVAEETPDSRRIGNGDEDEDEEKRKIQIHGRKLRSEGSPIEVRKRIQESGKGIRESGERTEKNSILRKKTDQSRKSGDGFSSRIGGDSKQTTKVKCESKTARKEESTKEIEGNKAEIGKNSSDRICVEFEECKEKLISSSRITEKRVPQVFVDARDSCSGEEEEDDEVLEIEKQSFDIKEINLPERKKMVNEVKKCHQINGKSLPSFTKPIQSEIFRENKQKLHSLMDLIMWRDIIRSAIVFGIGISIIIFSFFTKNIHISFITVMSYLGLLYIAAIFLHRSIICSRDSVDSDDETYMVGEEEAIWFAKLFVPYINGLQLNLRALFRGDPAMTMKLSVALFVLAKCGSFITIWNVVKWGFVGVFTVPKLCSWYSTQLITHGEYWMKLFGDSWKICDHKKAIAIAIFFAVWNFSSVVSRIWAVFVLFVSLRYFQQFSGKDGWVEDGDGAGNEQRKSSKRGEKLLNGKTFVVSSKQKRKY